MMETLYLQVTSNDVFSASVSRTLAIVPASAFWGIQRKYGSWNSNAYCSYLEYVDLSLCGINIPAFRTSTLVSARQWGVRETRVWKDCHQNLTSASGHRCKQVS